LVRLFNNSYTIFDNNINEDQIFQDCDSMEIYVSANSFPTIMRYKSALLATLPQIKKPKTDVSDSKPDLHNLISVKKGVLGECVPNPTSGTATISYELYSEGETEIRI